MNIDELRKAVETAAAEVREGNPLAGSVTNGVTMDFVANAQLAVGGSAAMVYLADEAEALVGAGNSFYVNMGTLLPEHADTMPAAVRATHEQGKTCVLDPVGIGIGSLRTSVLEDIKEYEPKIIRGNASEIIALAGLWGLEGTAADMERVRGVDTTDTVDAAQAAACALAQFTGGAVAISGAVDVVTDGTNRVGLSGGSAMMGCITGFGCSLGGVCAVYASVADPFTAAVAAAAHYNLAGTRADEVTSAPGSFKVAFIDELYKATPQDVASAPMEFV